ncbi:galactose-binding domain-like protein [Paraphysoderma sedebokerense]|nr:galactose-binding domain-like protein [Paraphysoderma sedebokerense]
MSCREDHQHSGCSHDHHSHGHGHGGHDHSDDKTGPERGDEASLYRFIDIHNVRCLNESVPDSGKTVIKPFENRLDETKFVESDCDEQLIFYIPFTGNVKLKSIGIRGGPEGFSPRTIKLFANHDHLDFDTVESTLPAQSIDLIDPASQIAAFSTSSSSRDGNGGGDVIWYNTKIAKFTNIRNLWVFVENNYGEDVTKISYLGFRGEWSEFNRDPIITIYEAAPNPADHQTEVNDVLKSNHLV